MKLYEISQQYDVLKRYINDAEADEEMFQAAFNDIQGALEDKAENIVKLAKNLEGDIEAHRNEEKRLAEKRRFMENRVGRLKMMLQDAMCRMDKQSIKAGTFNLRIQKNPMSLEVIDEGLVPDEYKRQRFEIDKKAILEAIKEGREIAGAEARQTESLRIR